MAISSGHERTCHSQELNVPPVDVESHFTFSSISHVTFENITQFLSFLLYFNAASENHQELSPHWKYDTAIHQAAEGGDILQL
jgi:hypothetical protein